MSKVSSSTPRPIQRKIRKYSFLPYILNFRKSAISYMGFSKID
uniref:Uncharacterized protein n=1 Tax=Myoviridae sp. ctn8H20 TaxID=2825169 RepID=A0A8S5QFS9_9CAUD|nr:MAG TPA: hypothetical protein [Myoviridae sp. ctn8H20]